MTQSHVYFIFNILRLRFFSNTNQVLPIFSLLLFFFSFFIFFFKLFFRTLQFRPTFSSIMCKWFLIVLIVLIDVTLANEDTYSILSADDSVTIIVVGEVII